MFANFVAGCHLLAIVGTSASKDRELMIADLLPLSEYPELVASLIQTVEKSKLGSTSKRRRTVEDRDCDSVEGLFDEIEDVCNRHRFEVLNSLESNFSSVLPKNSSQADRIAALNTIFEGEEMASSDISGIQKTMLFQKVAIYGGLDPQSNKDEAGLVSDLRDLIWAEVRMHNMSEASLDSLWKTATEIDERVGVILYEQVFKYGSLVDKMIKSMTSTGEDILSRDYAEMLKSSSEITELLASLSKEICDRQAQLGSEGKSATNGVSANEADISKAVEDLMSKSEDFLNFLDEKRTEAEQVTDKVSDSSDMLISNGQDAINLMMNNYASTLSTSLDGLIDAFASTSLSSLEDDQKGLQSQLRWIAGSIDSDMQGKLGEVQDKRKSIEAQIDTLRKSLSEITSNAKRAQSQKLNSVDNMLTRRAQNVSSFAASVQQSERTVSMQLSDASSQIDPLMNQMRMDLASQLNALSSISSSNLQSGVSEVEKVRQQMLAATHAAQSAMDNDIRVSQSNVGIDTMSSSQALASQQNAIRGVESVADAKLRLTSDMASSLLSSNLSPLLQSVFGSAAATTDIISEIVSARKNTVSDGKRAIEAAESANTQRLRAALLLSLLSTLNSTAAMNGVMSTATGTLEKSNADLTRAVGAFSDQNSLLSTLLASGHSNDNQSRNAIANLATQMAAFDDQSAGILDSRLREVLQKIQPDSQSVSGSAAGKVQGHAGEIEQVLATIIAQLRDHGGSYSSSIDSVASFSKMLSEMEEGLRSQSDGHNEELQTASSTFSSLGGSLIGRSAELAQTNEDKLTSEASNYLSSLFASLLKTKDSTLSRMNGLDSDPEVVSSLTARMEILKRLMDGLIAINPEGLKVIDDVQAQSKELRDLSQISKKDITVELMRMEHELLQVVNSTGNEVLNSTVLTPETIANAFMEAAGTTNRALDRGVHDAIQNLKTDAETVGESTLAAELDRDVSEASILDDIMTNFTALVSEQQTTAQQEVSQDRFQTSEAYQRTQTILAEAKVVADRIDAYKRESKSKMDDALSRALALVDSIDKAVGGVGLTLEREVAHSGANVDLMTVSDGVSASKLASFANSTVGDALAAVGSFSAALDTLLHDTDSETQSASLSLSSVGTGLDAAFHNVSSKSQVEADMLTQNLTIEQNVNLIRLGKIREFTTSVRDAWLRYSDSQREKFESLKETDRMAFANYMRLAENGFRDADDRIQNANRTVNVEIDSLNTANVNFTYFQSGYDARIARVWLDLENALSDGIRDNTTVHTTINEIRSDMTSHNLDERAQAEEEMKKFEASLDDISDRILQSVS